MKSVRIKNFPEYELYEDGRIWSEYQNKFLRPYRGTVVLRKNNKSYTVAVLKLMKENGLLLKAPDIEGVKHTVCNFDQDYQIYSNGNVWSRKQKRFLSHITTSRGFVLISIDSKHYRADELTYTHFVGPVLKGSQIKHKDGDNSNNNVANLALIWRNGQIVEVENNIKKGIEMNTQVKSITEQIKEAMEKFRKEQMMKLNEFEANLYKQKLIELFRENESEEVIAEIVKVANTYFAKLHCCYFDDDRSVQKITDKIWYYGLKEYFDSEIYGEI